MSSNRELSPAEKAAKTQNRIAAFQAYQNQKIASKLDNVSTAVAESNQLQSEIVRLQEQNAEESRKQTILLERQEKQNELDRKEREKINLVKQAIFEVSEELESIENMRISSPPAAMAKLADVYHQVVTHNVSPGLVDAFEEKTFIANTLKNLEQMVDGLQGDEQKLFQAFKYGTSEAGLTRVELAASEQALKSEQEKAESFIAEVKEGNLTADARHFIQNNIPGVESDTVLFPPSGIGSWIMVVVLAGFALISGTVDDILGALVLATPFLIRIIYLQVKRGSTKRVERALEPLNVILEQIQIELNKTQPVKQEAERVNREIQSINRDLDELRKKYDDISTIFPEPIEAVRYEDYIVTRHR
jgi:Skp family chaperone for outer membrane proteins